MSDSGRHLVGVSTSVLMLPQHEPIGTQRMLQILRELAAQQQRLSTDATFWQQQTASLQAALTTLWREWLSQKLTKAGRHRQLLHTEPLVLCDLAQITAGGMQQLMAQPDDTQLSITVSALGDTIGCLCQLLQERTGDAVQAASTPTDAANLRMFSETGLLRAYATTAKAAVVHLNRQQPATAPQQQQQTRSTTADGAAQEFSFVAACGSLLNLWFGIQCLMPTLDLMKPAGGNRLLRETVVPTAALALTLARSHRHRTSGLMAIVLNTGLQVARAAVPVQDYSAPADDAMLANQEVLEVILLVFAVGLQMLHADYKGFSRQRLVSDLRTPDCFLDSSSGGTTATAATSSSSSSSGSGRGGGKGGKGGKGTTNSKSSSSTASSPRAHVVAGHLHVLPHHQELLFALVGVREVDVSAHTDLAEEILINMSMLPCAVGNTLTGHWQHARAHLRASSANGSLPRMSSSSSSSSATPDSATIEARRRAAWGNELVPWQLCLPVFLAELELLALMPSFLAHNFSQVRQFLEEAGPHSQQVLQLLHFQQQPHSQRPAGLPPLATIQAQTCACLQSLWLQLGPVLLSLCNGEGPKADPHHDTPFVQLGNPASPRELFAPYASLLLAAFAAQDIQPDGVRCVSIAAVQQELLLCSKVVEAALHCLPAADGRTPAVVSNECLAASRAITSTAEAAARVLTGRASGSAAATAASSSATAATAAAGPAQDANALTQQVFSQAVAALKYAQVCGGGNRSRAPSPVHLFQHRLMLFAAVANTAHKILGDVALPQVRFHSSNYASVQPAPASLLHLTLQQQMVWFHLLARSLVAAGSLLQEVAGQVTARGDFVHSTDSTFSPQVQFDRYCQLLLLLFKTIGRLHSMLQPGATAAAAAAAGSAAATVNDVGRLRGEAGHLQLQIMEVHMPFLPLNYQSARDSSSSRSNVEVSAAAIGQHRRTAMQQLRTACQPSGGLLQALSSFGVACCSAFPQPGVCGNPACLNLDRFSEAALATCGCSGCNKAVKFCSAECHKAAWKSGHKAACAVLKQQHQQHAEGVGAEGSVVAFEEPEESEQYYSADEFDGETDAYFDAL